MTRPTLSLAFLGSLAVLTSPIGGFAQALPSSDDCRSCHLTLEDARLSEPASLYEQDIHAEAGFGCLACHGNQSGRLDPAAGFLSAPTRREIPELCGSCHSDAAFMRQFDPGLRVDQVAEYWTSVHGQRLRETNDAGVATCTDCHPAHEILPASDLESTVHPLNVMETCGSCHSDPRLMALRGFETTQVDEYSASVHGAMLLEEGDVSAPVCNDCHGNHGAAPPGVASVRNVCGQCHSVMADYFAESGHVSVFEEEDLPGCALCHDHHAIESVSDAQLMDRSADVCFACHAADDPLGSEFRAIAELLDSLDGVVAASRHVLEEAENLGMEVHQALFELEDVNNARTRARSAVHTFSSGPVREEVAAGLVVADQAAVRGEEALQEHGFRRVGLGVSVLIILFLISGLFLRMKEMDERLEGLIGEFEAYYRQVLGAGIEVGGPELRLAACALLLEATYADGRFTEEERTHVEQLIRVRFGLDPTEADELIGLAEKEREMPGGVGRLAQMIAEEFSPQQKRNLVNELWVLVYADGELTSHERRFVRQVSALLGLEEADVVVESGPVVSGPVPLTENPTSGDDS
jgi:predicted CXXCH cytochrome family protein